MRTVYAPKEGVLFWVLYWATHAVEDDPLAIIQYYSALRELHPLCSEYDKRLLRDGLAEWLDHLHKAYPGNITIEYHSGLIRELIGKQEPG